MKRKKEKEVYTQKSLGVWLRVSGNARRGVVHAEGGYIYEGNSKAVIRDPSTAFGYH